MENFKKIVRIGLTQDVGHVFCKIQYTHGDLSITGVEGPNSNGNCKGSAGQIDMSDWHIKTFAPGWDAAKMAQFRAIWKRWHLNDMTAGSPAQEEFLRTHPVEYKYPETHYDKALAALGAAGINPDPAYVRDGKFYHYGSAWLKEEVPADVLEWLKALPDTDETPAWI